MEKQRIIKQYKEALLQSQKHIHKKQKIRKNLKFKVGTFVKKMGGGVSIGYETSPARTYGPTMKKGRVMAFHSSKTWRIHHEASRQTSKLVKVV